MHRAMNSKPALLILALVVILLMTGAVMAFADTVSVDPNYPGYVNQHYAVDLAFQRVSFCTMSYYRVHGVWPQTWSEVVADGLCQVPLVSPNGYHVDPDDGSFDFEMDVQYSFDGSNAYISQSVNNNTKYKQLPEIMTYVQHLNSSAAATGRTEFTEMAQDEELLKLFALLGMCRVTIIDYQTKYGEIPASWQDLLDSGMLPYDGSSLNPKSGQPMSVTDGPWGIRYERIDEETYRLRHLTEDGSEPMLGISY